VAKQSQGRLTAGGGRHRLHETCTAKSRRFVQPNAVESDRAEFLLGDLYAFSARQLKPHT
jgi:hypothetical protein